MAFRTFDQLVSNFIQNEKAEKGERTHETYGRKILVFSEYLKSLGVTDDICGAALHQVDTNTVINSIKHYVNNYNIRFRSTTDTYFAALCVFFRYIEAAEGIKNEHFADGRKLNELKDAYEKIVKELRLNTKKQYLPLLIDESNRLIEICNNNISSLTNEDVIYGRERSGYTRFISSILCKLLLISGTKNNVLYDISLDDYDPELNKLAINQYNVRLPDVLAKQLRRYNDIRAKMVRNVNEKRFFVDLVTGGNLENAKIFTVLEKVTGNKQGTSITKYAIIQMLKNGLPSNIVREFTGYGNEVIGHCEELIDEEKGIYNLGERVRHMDSTLRQSEIYDML